MDNENISGHASAQELSRSGFAVASFALGLLAVFTYQLIIIPVMAAVFGAIAIAQFDPAKQKGKWMGITGLVLGIIYSLMGSLSLLGL